MLQDYALQTNEDSTLKVDFTCLCPSLISNFFKTKCTGRLQKPCLSAARCAHTAVVRVCVHLHTTAVPHQARCACQCVTCVCAYESLSAQVCRSMYICHHIHVNVYICIYMIHLYIYVNICVYICLYGLYIYIYLSSYTRIRIYMYIYDISIYISEYMCIYLPIFVSVDGCISIICIYIYIFV